MRPHRENSEGLATVVLRGPLTLGETAERLLATVRELLDGGVREIRLDAARIPYADARGLGAIAECGSLALARGARFSVEGASGKLREELQMTGLIAAEPRRSRLRDAERTTSRRSGVGAAKSFLRVVHSGVA